MRVKFFGVRGSCPCSSDQHSRYGGNTPCVVVAAGDDPPIILDLGSGLRPLGLELAAGATAGDSAGAGAAAGEPGSGIRLAAFLSHLHWDHIIGLPFFTTLHDPRNRIDIYGPPQLEGSLHDVFERVLHPPFFPVNVEQLKGDIRFCEVLDEEMHVGSAKVRVRQIPHVGTTLGFRVEADGASVAFVSDHQQPEDMSTVDAKVLELCDGVDLLIHDAQYTPEEFAAKSDWGHSTVAYAVHVAKESGARELALFHHDPLHLDEDIDELLAGARAMDDAKSLERVLAASEGLELRVGALSDTLGKLSCLTATRTLADLSSSAPSLIYRRSGANGAGGD